MNVVRVFPLSPVPSAARAFQAGGRLGVTVIVKVDYALVDDDVATRTVASALSEEDRVPYKPYADVLFSGNAYAPQGRPVAAMSARLAVMRDGKPLLDKRLIVSGDRVQTPTVPAPAAAPFTSMPIVWERALGGDGYIQNPVGVGANVGPNGERRLPNLAYAGEAMQRWPACFAPIAADAPMRRRFVVSGQEANLTRSVPELSEGIHYGYFQCAPPDQQVGFLRGDETIVLEGLTPNGAPFRTKLPGEVALARAYFPPTRVTSVELFADTLRINGDTGSCSVVWRGCFTATDLGMLEKMIVAIGVQAPGRPIQWPGPHEVESFMALVQRASSEPVRQSTMELSQAAQVDAGHEAAVPFRASPSQPPPRPAPHLPIPGAPWEAASPTPPPAVEHPFARTATIEVHDLSPETRRALAPGSSDFAVGMPSSKNHPPKEPPSSASRRKKIDPWAKSIESAPLAEVHAPAPRPPQKPAARTLLYGKMTKK